MSIIIKNRKLEVPGLKTTSWLDPEAPALKIKQVTDKSPRKTWIRSIVCHTVHGKLGKLLPGYGPNTDLDLRYARYQTNTERQVSWDFTEDFSGDWIIQNDPLEFFTWQAGAVNAHTCGLEMVQHDNGDLYEDQIQKAVLFIDFLTAILGIQRQIPWDIEKDKPMLRLVNRISGDGKGKDVVGVYNHSNQTSNRGPGDCGPWLPAALKAAGYLPFNFDKNEDKAFWKAEQLKLGLKPEECDGVPGPQTTKLLLQSGKKHGMIVPRTIDTLITIP